MSVPSRSQASFELLETASSETVKVRLIEFLLSDGKGPRVAVHVDVHVDARAMQPPVGYAYQWPSTDPAPDPRAAATELCELSA